MKAPIPFNITSVMVHTLYTSEVKPLDFDVIIQDMQNL